MYIAAVFGNGNIATGVNHGDAFMKMSEEDKNAEVISGHVNPDGTFTTEMSHLNKEIILIRHGESMWNIKQSDSLDSHLSPMGVFQAMKLAEFLSDNIDDFHSFVGHTSPYHRCLLTSMPLRKAGLRFFVEPDLAELTDHYPESGITVPCRRSEFPDIEWGNYTTTHFGKEPSEGFLGRLHSFAQRIPDRSIIVTHGSVVQTMIEIALGVRVERIPTWDNSIGNASVTYIKGGTVVWLARGVA